MSKKCPARKGNPDLRQQKHVPAPPIEEIDSIFYAVLNQLCIDLAMPTLQEGLCRTATFSLRDATQTTKALNQPLDRISTQMVFRELYHFSQAVLRGDAYEVVTYLVEHQRPSGKAEGRRQKAGIKF
jgi:hypothetical protein